jgi:hypothetical protein
MSFNRPNQNYFGSTDPNANRLNPLGSSGIQMNNPFNMNQNNTNYMNNPTNLNSSFTSGMNQGNAQVTGYNQMNQGIPPQNNLQNNNFLQMQQNTKVPITEQGTTKVGAHFQRKALDELFDGKNNTSKFIAVVALDEYAGYEIEELRYIDYKLKRGQVVNLHPSAITSKGMNSTNSTSNSNTNNFMPNNQNQNQNLSNPLYRGAPSSTLNDFNKYLNPSSSNNPSNNTLTSTTKFGPNNTWNNGVNNPIMNAGFTSTNNMTNNMTNNFTSNLSNNNLNGGVGALPNNTNNLNSISSTNPFTKGLTNNTNNYGAPSNTFNSTFNTGNAFGNSNPMNPLNNMGNVNSYGIKNNLMTSNTVNTGSNINTFGGLNKPGSVTFNSSLGVGGMNQGYNHNNYSSNLSNNNMLSNPLRSPTSYNNTTGNSLNTNQPNNNFNAFTNKGTGIGMGTAYPSNPMMNNPLSGLSNLNTNNQNNNFNNFNPFTATSPRSNNTGITGLNNPLTTGMYNTSSTNNILSGAPFTLSSNPLNNNPINNTNNSLPNPFQYNQNIRPGNVSFTSSNNINNLVNANPLQPNTNTNSLLNSSIKVPFASTPSFSNNSLNLNSNNIMIPNSFKQTGLGSFNPGTNISTNNTFQNSIYPSPFQLRPQSFTSIPGNITFTNPQGQNNLLNHQQMSLGVNQILNNRLFPQFTDYLGIEAMKTKVNDQLKNIQKLSSKEIEEIMNFDSIDKENELKLKDNYLAGYNSMSNLGNYNTNNIPGNISLKNSINGYTNLKANIGGDNLDNRSVSTFTSHFKPNYNSTSNNIPAFSLTAKPDNNYKSLINNNGNANPFLTANKYSINPFSSASNILNPSTSNNNPFVNPYSSNLLNNFAVNNLNNSSTNNEANSRDSEPFNLFFSKPHKDELQRKSLTEVKPNCSTNGNRETLSNNQSYYKSPEFFQEIERLSNEAQMKVLGFIPGTAASNANSNNINAISSSEIKNNFSTIKKELNPLNPSNPSNSSNLFNNSNNPINNPSNNNLLTFANNKTAIPHSTMNTIPEVKETQSALLTPIENNPHIKEENIINSPINPSLYNPPLSPRGFNFSEKKKPSNTNTKAKRKPEDDPILNLKFKINNPVDFNFNVKINKRNKVKDLRLAIEEILKENYPGEFGNLTADKIEILTKTGMLKDSDIIESKEFVNEKETLLVLVNNPNLEKDIICDVVESQSINDFQFNDVSSIKSFHSFNAEGNNITNINKFPNHSDFIDYVPVTKKYKTCPDMKKLGIMSREELQAVESFTIYNNFAKIIFKGLTDVTYLNLDEIVTLEPLYVNVYDRLVPPEQGEKLNREARVFMFDFESEEYQESDEDFAEFIMNIKKSLSERNAKFVSYDPKLEQLVFDVPNFNRK